MYNVYMCGGNSRVCMCVCSPVGRCLSPFGVGLRLERREGGEGGKERKEWRKREGRRRKIENKAFSGDFVDKGSVSVNLQCKALFSRGNIIIHVVQTHVEQNLAISS